MNSAEQVTRLQTLLREKQAEVERLKSELDKINNSVSTRIEYSRKKCKITYRSSSQVSKSSGDFVSVPLDVETTRTQPTVVTCHFRIEMKL